MLNKPRKELENAEYDQKIFKNNWKKFHPPVKAVADYNQV